MIDRYEILDIAKTLGLLPNIVEKDYVLGWVLAGLYEQTVLAKNWIFKGGTCLKKCYFETYRFSEDLDFTVIEPRHINRDFLANVFRRTGEWVYEQTGIELPEELQEIDIYENPRNTVSCQCKLSYRGPIAPRSGGLPRIKIDLTLDELLVLPQVERTICHDYSDAPEDGISVLCYSYEEAFAEKVRALGDRARPRDLYDVINLYRNNEARPHPSVLLSVLEQKCAHRDLPTPTLQRLENFKGNLDGSWQPMLGHQLQDLPPVESFWEVLPEFFTWLITGTKPAEPATYHFASGETLFRERTSRLPFSGRIRSYLEIIRFAAANRLCVDLKYNGSVRRVEPYSLRRTRQGNFVLHATRASDDEHRSYRIDRIESAKTTRQIFVPRFAVELSPQGPLVIPPTATRSNYSSRQGRGTHSSLRSRESKTWLSGTRYVHECAYCGKRFIRKKNTTQLNSHKDQFGSPRTGITGFPVDTRF